MQFHQHPDGWVYLRGDDGRLYNSKLNEFETDFGEPLPELPAGGDERIYDSGRRHAIHNRDGLVDGGPMPWAYGERALAKIDEMIIKQKAREKEALAKENAALVELANRLPNGGHLSDRRLFQALANRKAITEEEALAAMYDRKMPEAVMDRVAELPEEEQFTARMWLTSSSYAFTDSLVPVLLLPEMDEEERDKFWRYAATL